MTREVRIKILESKDLSIFIIGTYGGMIRGYELNSEFYWKKNKKKFIKQLENRVKDENKIKEILSKIKSEERRHKRRTRIF